MKNKIGPFTTEDLITMRVEHISDPKIYTTPGGAFVFTGDEFIALSEPIGNDAVTINPPPIGNGMTIKDVARHKDVVKLQQRVMELEVAMSNLVNGKDFSIGQETYWKESE